MLPHQISVQQRHWTSADLEELGQERVGNRRFARTRQSGKENRQALPAAWWEAPAKLMHDFRIGKPSRNLAPFIEPLTQFRTRNVEHAIRLLDFIVRYIAVLVLEVHHHAERHHGDAD